MKKRITALLLAFVLIIGVLPASAFTEGLENFQKVFTYRDQFTDVPSSQWYASSVKESYEYGLMTGTAEDKFAPGSNVTIAQAITLAARLHSTYYVTQDDFSPIGDKWYNVYVYYAEDYGIISPGTYSNYNVHATRAQFTEILSNAFPSSAYQAINNIPSGTIPDVPMHSSYSASVYMLYRAGILTGNDNKGTFSPNSSIKRSEVASLSTRMVDASLRQRFTLTVVEPTPAPTPSPQPTVSPTASPKPEVSTVYWVDSGEVYHQSQGCPSLSRSKNIRSGSISSAKSNGKSRSCKNCW